MTRQDSKLTHGFLTMGKMAKQDGCKLFALFFWIDDKLIKENVS